MSPPKGYERATTATINEHQVRQEKCDRMGGAGGQNLALSAGSVNTTLPKTIGRSTSPRPKVDFSHGLPEAAFAPAAACRPAPPRPTLAHADVFDLLGTVWQLSGPSWAAIPAPLAPAGPIKERWLAAGISPRSCGATSRTTL